MATVTSFPLTTTNNITSTGSTGARSLADRFSDIVVVDDYASLSAARTAAGTNKLVIDPNDGRAYLPHSETFDLASNVLAVGNYWLPSATISVGASKQLNLFRYQATISQESGSDFSIHKFDVSTTGALGSDAYAFIGSLTISGAGSAKPIYGRAVSATDHTGFVVGGVFGVGTQTTTGASYAIQITNDTDAGGSVNAAIVASSNTETAANLARGVYFDETNIFSQAIFTARLNVSPGSGDFLRLEDSTETSLFKVIRTGHTRGPNGSIGAPSYSFLSDTDTGIYLEGDGILGVAVAGQQRLRVISNAFTPGTNDGMQIGSTTRSFSDLFLASGAVINYNNGAQTVTNSGSDLAFSGTVTLDNVGLHLLDTDSSHDLVVKPGSNLSADRTLTVTTGDSDRTITLSGNPTLNDWFDQSVKAAASPTFVGLTLSGALSSTSTAVFGTSLQVSRSGNASAIQTYRTDAHGAAQIGRFEFLGRNTTPAQFTYGQILSSVTDDTAGSEDSTFSLLTALAGTLAARLTIGGGLYHTSATGGDKGNNTINFGAVYDDNTLLTDYVFDKWLGNQAGPYSTRVAEAAANFDVRMLDQAAYSGFFTENRRLYGMPDLNDCIDGVVKEHSLGAMIQKLWMNAELQAIHTESVVRRLSKLENQKAA